tara:strand:+ start:394 stop:636 length:243 start_codon:yes stop_codon:yes gene_type:complete
MTYQKSRKIKLELALEKLENDFRDDLGTITTDANLTEIAHLREMHRIGQSLIDFAKNRSRELSDEICEKAGPEIAKRHRG